jgi:FdhD protein
MTHTGSKTAQGTQGGQAVEWLLADEIPTALVYNGQSHAVMLATPLDLEDFAVGFSLTEEIVATVGDIDAVEARESALGMVIDIRVDPARLSAGAQRRRALAGRSGCGLCGVESLAGAVRDPPPRVAPPFPLTEAAATRAFAALPALQPLNRENRSVHAAAWADMDGNIGPAREDVGRHNALDKLIGALARDGADFAQGFAVMSSRCSFELAQKAAAVGIGGLATLSAPTALALDLARRAGVILAAKDGDGAVIFGDAGLSHFAVRG